MRRRPWKWGVALGLSGALHAGAAVFILPRENQVQIAGGQGLEIAIAGTAFADLTAAGSPTLTVEPVAEPDMAIAPVEPSTAEPVDPVESTATAVPLAPSAQPDRAETPAQAAVTPEAERPETIQPETAEPAPGPSDAIAIEPVEPQDTVTAMVDVPRPTPRPAYDPPKVEPKRTTAAAQRQELEARRAPARRKAQQSAGSGGRDRQDARRGTSEAGNQVQARAGAAAGRAAESGNAAVSNYPGKVVSRLRRALRYPREARGQRLRGEVQVAFTVTNSGAVSGIRVVRSSGSSILDQAAVETVRRAAPFPAIPPGAGRSSWPFTVPLAFVR